jgi:hypothetical protein
VFITKQIKNDTQLIVTFAWKTEQLQQFEETGMCLSVTLYKRVVVCMFDCVAYWLSEVMQYLCHAHSCVDILPKTV